MKRKKKMQYECENSLTMFSFWSGAKTNADKLTYEELETLDSMVQDLFGEEIPTETQINDLFWFDFGTICDLLGLTEEEVDSRQ